MELPIKQEPVVLDSLISKYGFIKMLASKIALDVKIARIEIVNDFEKMVKGYLLPSNSVWIEPESIDGQDLILKMSKSDIVIGEAIRFSALIDINGKIIKNLEIPKNIEMPLISQWFSQLFDFNTTSDNFAYIVLPVLYKWDVLKVRADKTEYLGSQIAFTVFTPPKQGFVKLIRETRIKQLMEAPVKALVC